MAKDVLITPLDGIIQFSSSAGSGSGQIKVDGDDLVVSNLIGDVLLGDGASDIFIGNGTDNVDIVFEQNGEIRDDGSGKTITIGNKTTTLVLSSSSDITMQEKGGNVGIGTSAATVPLQVTGIISSSGGISSSGNLTLGGGIVSASGGIKLQQTADIVFGPMSTFPTTNTTAIQWDFPSDDTFIYAQQSSSDVTTLVFEQRDNTTSDANVFWFNDYQGATKDSFPLYMDGGKLVVNYIYDRRVVFARDATATNGISNNVDFYLLKSGSSSVSKANSLIFGDVSTSEVTFNGNVSASGFVSASSFRSDGDLTLGGSVVLEGSGINITNDSSTELNFNGTNNTNITTAGNLFIKAGSSKKLYLGANATDQQVTLDTNGNFGIGTTSPTQELDLRGELFISSSTNSISPILIHNSSGSISLKLTTDANQHNDFFLYKQSGEKVKLRTYWPSKIDNDYYETGGGLILGSERAASTNFYGLYISSGSNSGSLAVADTDLVVSASKVGIGTKSPKAELHVEGNVSGSHTGSFGKITIGTTTPANHANQLTVKGGEQGNAIAHFERTLGGTGTIKISANASEPQINFKADNDSERFNIGVERAGGAFVIASGSSIADKEIVVVTQDNKVGINTTAPTKELTIEGDISASGDFILGDLGAGPFISGSQGGLKVSGSGITIHNGSADGVLKIQRFGGDIGQLSAANTRFTVRALNNKDLSLEDDAGNVGVFVKDGGKVGIGATTTPTVALQVTGEISSSSTGSFGQLEVAESTLTGSMKPLKGTFNIHYGTNAQFTGSLSTNGTGYGEIMSNFNIHTELDKGEICYLINRVWRKADADGEASTTKMLGVALADGMSSGGQPVLIRGVARLRVGHIADASGDEGDLVYLSTTAGKVQFAAPSTSGQFVRIVGYCLNEANDIIYFDPDKSFVEVA